MTKLQIFLTVTAVAAAAAAALLILTRPRTPAFPGTGGIASIETVGIGGIPQGIVIRGERRDNPILLYLHGGPGLAETGLFRHYNAPLEKDFLAVYWDQRGAGRSWHSSLAEKPMDMEPFVTDVGEMARYLTERFGQEKVYLAAHSWGTMIGMLAVRRYPELFHAYVGTGQCADMPEGEALSYRYVLEQARKRNETRALEELEALGPPENGVYGNGLAGTDIQRKWLLKFGGAAYGRSDWNTYAGILLRTQEYSLTDRYGLLKGMNMPSKNLMVEKEFLRCDLAALVPEVDVPVWFFLGRQDYQIPSETAAAYFRELRAPRKELVWFEQSAHSPCFEEPEKFNRLMVEMVLKTTEAETASDPQRMTRR